MRLIFEEVADHEGYVPDPESLGAATGLKDGLSGAVQA
jgi:hypothetical protein